MNLQAFHTPDKMVSATQLFKGEGSTITLQIQQNQELREHISKVPALLICVIGEVVFVDEKGQNVTLKSGDIMHIEPFVKHRVLAKTASQLLLLK